MIILVCKNMVMYENQILGRALLQKMGEDLDNEVYPVVHDCGIVEPGQSHSQLQEPGMEDCYERQTTRGSTAGPRKRTAGGPWSSGEPPATGSGSTSTTSSFFSEYKLSDATVAYLEGVVGAYPTVQFRFTPDLVWLVHSIKPIRGLNETALLITAYPNDVRLPVKSWAWWGPGLIWIGPRHTNYPDGSICSFEPTDPDAWQRGKPLRDLLDIHAVWIVRHLFLRYFGRWPGRQVFHTEYERLREHRPGELCGGCSSGLKYEQCCRPRDERKDPIERVFSFIRIFGHCERIVPKLVSDFVYGDRQAPPSLTELIALQSYVSQQPDPFRVGKDKNDLVFAHG